MGNKIAIAIVIIALGVGGYFLLTSDSESGVGDSESLVGSNNNGSSNSTSTSNGSTSTAANTRPENYVDYSETAIATATENGGRALLFFHANWCPTCRAAEKDVFKNYSDLPDDLTIIKTDYDTETALKKKYSVNYQHTFVQVDAAGEMVTKWAGGGVKTINQNVEEI